MPEHKFLGKEVSNEDRKDFEESLDKVRKEAQILIEGETEKTEEDIERIKLMNQLIDEEFRELGLEPSLPIHSDNVRIVPKEFFVNQKPFLDLSGLAAIVENTIYIKERGVYETELELLEQHVKNTLEETEHSMEDVWNNEAEKLFLEETGADELYFLSTENDELNEEEEKQLEAWLDFQENYFKDRLKEEEELERGSEELDIEEVERYEEYHVLLHEMLHLKSHQRLDMDPLIKKINLKRTGYYVAGSKKNYFESFNEAITERITLEILKKNGINEPKYNFFNREAYYSDREVFEIILSKVAEHTNRNKKDVWEEFKKEYFAGGTKHLSQIEQALGRGSLKAYAALQAADEISLDKFSAKYF